MSARKSHPEKEVPLPEPEGTEDIASGSANEITGSASAESDDTLGQLISRSSPRPSKAGDSPTKTSANEVIPTDRLKRMQKKYSQDAKILNRLFFSRVITKDQFEIAEIKVKERLRIIDDLLAKEEDIENLAKIKSELETSLESLLRKYKLNEASSCTEEDIADIKRLCSDNILSGGDIVPGKGDTVRDEKINLLTRKIDDIFNNYIVDLTESAVDQLDRLPSESEPVLSAPKKSGSPSTGTGGAQANPEKKGALSRLKSAFSFK